MGLIMYLEQNGTLIYDGIISSDFGVWIEGGGTYNAAARRFETVTVPGRNGSLTISEDAYDEIEHTYKCFIGKGFERNIEAFRGEIMTRSGYCRLEDSYHPDEFYRARYMTGLEVDVAPRARGGQFDLTFRRDPRRFLKTGETVREYTANGVLQNPTAFPSRPLMRVYGYGSVTIGTDIITVAQAYPYVDIDCEIMDCFYGTTNANGLVSFSATDFPQLGVGVIPVRKSGHVTKVEVTPRWWRI